MQPLEPAPIPFQHLQVSKANSLSNKNQHPQVSKTYSLSNKNQHPLACYLSIKMSTVVLKRP